MKPKYSTAAVNSEGELRNRIETASQIVRRKLLSLKVTARATSKLAGACIRNEYRQFVNEQCQFTVYF